MKCPHCLVEFHDKIEIIRLGMDADGGWLLYERKCPACNRFIFQFLNGPPGVLPGGAFVGVSEEESRIIPAWPHTTARPPCPPEVPSHIAEDYKEACLVLSHSPKASAALSRRCLQAILREAAGVKKSNLNSEIKQVIDIGNLPSHLTEVLHTIREIGNLAAHPEKDSSTGIIVPVEPGEAEWNLDVLEALFDFYYVQPALTAKRKAALNAKLSQAGKKLLA